MQQRSLRPQCSPGTLLALWTRTQETKCTTKDQNIEMSTLSWMLHQHDKQFIWQGEEHPLSLTGFSSSVSRTNSVFLPGNHYPLDFASCLILFWTFFATLLDSWTLFPDSSLLLVQSEAEIRNKRPVTPSEKENLFSLQHCPDGLSELEKLNGPRCRTTQHHWSSGAWSYTKWDRLTKLLRFGSCLLFYTLYKYFERGERKKTKYNQQKKPQSSAELDF